MEKEKFKNLYQKEVEYIFSSPGRINLIGEHLDYNGGTVLPMAIDLGIKAYLAKRNDNIINLASLNYENDVYTTNLEDLQIKDYHWSSYVIGPLKVLREQGISFNQGYDILLSSDLPMASGLSSSACLEVLTIYMFTYLNHINIEKIDMAKYARNSEMKYCHVNCGIMDQACIALAKKDYSLLLGTSSLDYEYVNTNFHDYDILILSTNKQRELKESKFNERVEECNEAFNTMKKSIKCNGECLAKCTMSDLESVKDYLSNKAYKRAKHVITENKRVYEMVAAIINGEYAKIGEILNKSHESLKNDFEVSGPHLDLIVELALKYKALGARMTGAGFGGAAICVVKKENTTFLIENVKKEYYENTKIHTDIYIAHAMGGPHLLWESAQ